MFYLFKQRITKLEVNNSQLSLKQGISLQSSARKLKVFLVILKNEWVNNFMFDVFMWDLILCNFHS